MLCDSEGGGDMARQLLSDSEKYCRLGIRRKPISRMPGVGDVAGIRHTLAMARDIKADVIHGHGAKGGLYARLAGKRLGIASLYTPHGGSLYYDWSSRAGKMFLSTEWALARIVDAQSFVCAFERDRFMDLLGHPKSRNIVAYNGLWGEEFETLVPDANAADVVLMGDMRPVKGVDILLEALALLNSRQRVSAHIVGDGPDMSTFQALATRLNLDGQVKFLGRLPTKEALRKGRLLVMPSRHESFPYTVLEALAGQVPIITSRVGGIGEALPDHLMLKQLDPPTLADKIHERLAPGAHAAEEAVTLREMAKKRFSAERMTDDILAFYGDLLTPAARQA
jgi:glycosyltransferase involved in cell wall biosynthesis